MSTARFINDQADAFIKFTRRFRRLRNAFDAVFREPLFATSQFLVNLRRKNEHLALAEEKLLPGEAEITKQITAQMCEFIEKHYRNGVALRAGNTKTHGLLRAEFEVLPNLPDELRQGVFQTARTYKALVRFAGPGPFAPADVDDNGILSISIKLLGVEGEKLLAGDERMTQDFTGISAPTFTTPDVRENLKLQKHIYAGTPVLYFLSPFDSHLLDALQQGLYAKLYGNPLEARYFSCVPYLYGDGRAVQYSIRPRGDVRTRVPRRPSPNYLREAMAKTLGEREAVFDFMVQFQTDAHRMPLENASVRWPEKLSPYRPVATLRIPAQQFDSLQQLEFDRKLSFNPWHSIAAHRPLGNQNRARRHIYLETSKFRQRMNGDERVEPTEGDFP